jgi:hypothetical protein
MVGMSDCAWLSSDGVVPSSSDPWAVFDAPLDDDADSARTTTEAVRAARRKEAAHFARCRASGDSEAMAGKWTRIYFCVSFIVLLSHLISSPLR